MKPSPAFLILFVTVLFISNNLQGQNSNNPVVVKQIYDAFQNKNSTSKLISALTPGIKWNEVRTAEEVENKYSITFSSIMKNEWGGILFEDLSFQITGKSIVLVTGTVKGRQPTECELISTHFKHYWTIKEGQVIRFLE